MKHDPAKLAANIAAYRAKYAAALADINAQIDTLTAKRDKLAAEIHAGHKTFADGLIFSATARCKCGAGLCYEEGKTGLGGAWTCSVCVLADRANLPMEGWDKSAHQAFPFREYEIKSEDQPSAMGQTTRSEPVEIL